MPCGAGSGGSPATYAHDDVVKGLGGAVAPPRCAAPGRCDGPAHDAANVEPARVLGKHLGGMEMCELGRGVAAGAPEDGGWPAAPQPRPPQK